MDERETVKGRWWGAMVPSPDKKKTLLGEDSLKRKEGATHGTRFVSVASLRLFVLLPVWCHVYTNSFRHDGSREDDDHHSHHASAHLSGRREKHDEEEEEDKKQTGG